MEKEMEAYDDFSCNLDEDGKPVPPIPPLKSFYHGNITARDADYRLKQSQVGSYLVRLNNLSGKAARDFNYMISYAISSTSSSSTPGSLQVLHRGLEIEIGSEDLIPEILRKQDPSGKKFVTPLYPPLYPDASFKLFKCGNCSYKSTDRGLFVHHQKQEKILARKKKKQEEEEARKKKKKQEEEARKKKKKQEEEEEARKKNIFNCLECDFNSVVKKDFVRHFNRTHKKQDEKNLIDKELKKKMKDVKPLELKIQNTLSSYGIMNQNKIIVDDKLKNDDIDNIIVF